MPAPNTDWAAIVSQTSREAFVAAHRFPFLMGAAALQRPFSPTRTIPLFAPALRSLATLAPSAATAYAEVPQQTRLVLAVVKTQRVFSDMITIGRTANNDLVIPDVTVSKFHAWFRVRRAFADGLELVDAGSRNGTKVAGKAVPPKESVLVTRGTRLSFGAVELVLHDAGECWDEVRAWVDELPARTA